MKKMYWTAYNIHPYLMMVLCIISLLCLYGVETNKNLVKVADYPVKLEATLISKKSFEAIRKYRLNQGISIDRRFDSTGTGLIGVKNSIITSDHGVLKSKLVAANPNLAALIVAWLNDLKLKKGDVVAIGMTGSFPSLDISTLAAIKALKLKPLIIVSGSSSQWGANLPNLTILDMLAVLKSKDLLNYPILASSLGAAKDLGKSLDPKGITLLKEKIKQYNIPLIEEPLVSKSINKRLELYKQVAGTKKIKAYINIGGGVASIGKHFAETDLTTEQKEEILTHSLKTGPNTYLPVALADTNSVAVRFLKEGIPVINLKNINLIAAHYNLHPWEPTGKIGVGPLFYTQQYNLWLASIALILILCICWVLVKVQLAQKKSQDVLIQQQSQGPIL